MGGNHAHWGEMTEADRRARLRAGMISLVVGIVLLVAKFYAWHLTGSQVVFSDAMESIVNVLAASFMLFAVVLASQPADENHPYGHGKIEFVTSGFEGGLIAFAAIAIVSEAISALLHPEAPQRLETGIVIVGAAGVANALLGFYLVRVGKRVHSRALVADGQHVLSDFWTSAGAVIGLALVHMTGLVWLDAAFAIIVGLYLARTGWHLLREAARGLMDEAHPEVIGQVADALESAREPGIIEIHDLRAIDLGTAHHVDLHVVIPEFWTVHEAHDRMDAYHERVLHHTPRRADLQFHMDPCERAYCGRCDLTDCAVREADFTTRRPFTADTVASGPQPPEPTDIHDDPLPRPTDDG